MMIFMNIMMIFTIIIFFLCIYKMVVVITKETFENNDVEAITDGFNTLWLNERHVEKKVRSQKFTINYKQIQQNIQKMQM